MFERHKIAEGEIEHQGRDYDYEIFVRDNHLVVSIEGDMMQPMSNSFEVFVGERKNENTKAQAGAQLRKERTVGNADYRAYIEKDRGIYKQVLMDAGFRVESPRDV